MGFEKVIKTNRSKNHFAAGIDPVGESNFDHGKITNVAKEYFPVLKGLSCQSIVLNVDAVREPHYHPNAHQLGYCISGNARIGIICPEGDNEHFDLISGEFWFVPQGYTHWIENSGKTSLYFLELLSHEDAETINLSETFIGIPKSIFSRVLNISEDALAKLPANEVVIK